MPHSVQLPHSKYQEAQPEVQVGRKEVEREASKENLSFSSFSHLPPSLPSLPPSLPPSSSLAFSVRG